MIIIQDLNKYIPGGVLDPAQLNHELEAPESKYRLARAVLQEIPRQVSQLQKEFEIIREPVKIGKTFIQI